jgi:hypothetical protein
MAAVTGEPFADLRRDATLPQETTIPFAVITAIRLYVLWSGQGMVAAAGNWRR